MNFDQKEQPVRVVFILGAGRSGSTVMDIVLGSHPDVVSVGELSNLHRSGWTNNEYCSCGERGQQCHFWSNVLDEWKTRAPEAEVSQFLNMQSKFENFHHFGYRQWVRLGRERLCRSNQFKEFAAHTNHLYQSISQVSGKRIIVDSSKNPLRAALLSQIPGIDLRVVHLVRDGRAVAWSRKKSFDKNEKAGVANGIPSRPIWYSVAYWMVVNLVSGCVRKSHSAKSTRIRYEDFVADPEDSLARIGRLVGVDYSQVVKSLINEDAMQVGHTIAGNRVRMTGNVKLKADLEWTRMLPARDRRICWAIAGWLLYLYRYRRTAHISANAAPRRISPKQIGALLHNPSLLDEPRVSPA